MTHRLSKVADRSPKAWAWEDRSILKTHPMAQRGLQGAWCNRIYSVQYVVRGALAVLQVRRHDNGKNFPWRDLQRIKDELVGAEREAVQVFPRAADIVDVANMAHLWLIPEGERWPYTFQAFADAGDPPEPHKPEAPLSAGAFAKCPRCAREFGGLNAAMDLRDHACPGAAST